MSNANSAVKRNTSNDKRAAKPTNEKPAAKRTAKPADKPIEAVKPAPTDTKRGRKPAAAKIEPITLADLARELGVSPKLARAKARKRFGKRKHWLVEPRERSMFETMIKPKA